MANSNSIAVARLAANPLFPELMLRVKNFGIGTEFTIRGCFRDHEWHSYPKDVRLSLGRLFKNNVDNQNITGISAIPRKTSNNTQKYRVTGFVTFAGKFMMDYIGYYDNYGAFIKDIRQIEKNAVLFYTVKKAKEHTLSIKVTCKSSDLSSSTPLFEVSKQIKISNDLRCESHHIRAIIAIWFSLLTLWYNEDKLHAKGIKKVTICSSNTLMLERCAGYRTDTHNNLDYETIIQTYLKDFIIGNRMGLNFIVNAVALDQKTYHRLINS